jgi:hypothetical protein
MKKIIINFKIITLYIFCFLLIASCSCQKSEYLKDKKMTLIQNSKYIKWVTGKEYNLWEPSNIELKKTEEILIKAINENQFYFLKEKKLSEIKKNYRQYLCYINDKGEKVVYINSMCDLFTDYDKENNPISFDWKNKMIDISDGGECYWNIKINLSTNEYYELKINGRS